MDGAGVSDTDYILYLSASMSQCPGQSIIAFAGACQLESILDRPIAGFINFCPNNLGGTTRDFLFEVAKHELLHALGFSSFLIPFWRDSTGSPRTPRDSNQRPPFNNVYVLCSLVYLHTVVRCICMHVWACTCTCNSPYTVYIHTGSHNCGLTYMYMHVYINTPKLALHT